MTKRSGWLVAVVSMLVVTTSATVRADDCLLGPVSLPGLYGPPIWFDPGASGGTWRPELQDPRWSGSPLTELDFTPSGAAANDGMVRVLVSGTTLYVAFQVLADDVTAATDFIDAVYFGFTEGASGNGAYVVSVRPDRTTTPVAAPATGPHDDVMPVDTSAGQIDWWHTVNATVASPPTCTVDATNCWQPHPSDKPSWLDDVATWNGSPGAVWGVTFKVDLSDPLLAISGAMRLAYGMRINNSGGILEFTTPTTLPAVADAAGDSILWKSSGNFCGAGSDPCWQPVDAPGSPCTTGISVDRMDVGVWTGSTLSNQIQGCTGAGCPAAGLANQFRLIAQGVPTLGVTNHAVRARIRLADWGSTIADPLAPWKSIWDRCVGGTQNGNNCAPDPAPCGAGGGVCTSAFTLNQSALNADPNWNWSFLDSGDGTGVATIDFTCTPAANSYCPQIANATVEDHQCMLVELAGAPGTDYTFQRAAVYRNMDFAGLSELSRPATISIAGLQAITGQAKDRDVYLYVQSQNLPEHGSEPVFLNTEAMDAARRYATAPPPRPANAFVKRPNRERLNARALSMRAAVADEAATADEEGGGENDAPPPAPAPGKDVSPTIDALDVPVMTADQVLQEAFPTYQVRVYYDTGRKVQVKGPNGKVQERPLLQPMVPFGYYLTHDGPLYGFSQALAAEGAQLEEIAPSFYRVKVENEGSIRVRTTITAREEPKGKPAQCPACEDCPTCPEPGGCGCSIPGRSAIGPALPALLAFGALAFWLRRRRRARRG